MDRIEGGRRYSKGKAGPVSRMKLEIRDVVVIDDGPQSRARGDGIAEMAGGRLKAVSFLVQGGNLAPIRDRMARDEVLDVDVRWTGGTAVTIVATHDLPKAA